MVRRGQNSTDNSLGQMTSSDKGEMNGILESNSHDGRIVSFTLSSLLGRVDIMV